MRKGKTSCAKQQTNAKSAITDYQPENSAPKFEIRSIFVTFVYLVCLDVDILLNVACVRIIDNVYKIVQGNVSRN